MVSLQFDKGIIQHLLCQDQTNGFLRIKGAEGSADLKICKAVILSLNHRDVWKTKPIYTKESCYLMQK